MGRRKIEIKAIKDDRNRSVTFLKRKGGLFKKAHELSVLCSVDVAVIIFGHNKKLYEFSSGDINETLGRYQYYGVPHEHKGPEDFLGKRDGDDEDEDDENVGSPHADSHSPPENNMMPAHLQNQSGFRHIGQQSSTDSPPMPNGLPYQHRHHTPQPPGISRPSSQNAVRRNNSTAMQHHPSQTSQPGTHQGNYAYMPNPPIYNPQAQAPTAPMKMPQNYPQHPPQPQHAYSQPAPQAQMQQTIMENQRRQSMPPAYLPQDQQQPMSQPGSEAAQAQTESNNFQSPPLPQPKPLPAAAKSHSIFTPIDDSRSLLAQRWGSNTTTEAPPPRQEPPIRQEEVPRPTSTDGASVSRNQNESSVPSPPLPSLPYKSHGTRTGSVSSIPSITPATRTSSMQTDAKRPRLKVQIPSEQSDGGSATGDSSPKDSAGVSAAPPPTTKASTESSHSSAVVLPPPSPSASALLSAGAQGPPNPFARPAPPMNSGSYGSNMETPISALPSRFVADGLLPSPSSFYPPEWGFGRDSNMLPSPLTFQTPVGANGPSFKEEDAEKKRKSTDGSDGGANKKLKS